MVRPTVFATSVVLTALVCMTVPAGAQSRGGQGRSGGSVGHAAPRVSGTHAAVGHAVPRAAGHVGVGAQHYQYARPYYGHSYYAPSYYAHAYYGHPYYAFQPRFSIGVGLWVGFPVAYPYGYSYPYPYAYGAPYPYPAPAYGYPAPGYPTPGYPSYGPPASAYPPANYPAQTPGSIGVQPGQGASGGVSFETTPDTAAVYVDGQYTGTVANFSPNSQPLTLAPGRHHVEVRAPGYQTMATDVDVTPGQVIPFQGAMQRIRP